MEAEVQAQQGRAVVHLLFLSRCLVGKWNHSYGSWTAPGSAVCNLGTQESYQADSPAFPSFWALFGPSVCWVALMKERAVCFGRLSVWRLMSWESLLYTEDMSSRHQHPLTQLVPTYFWSLLLKLCLPSLLLTSLDNDAGCHNSC